MHLDTHTWHRAAVLARSVQGVRPWAIPCVRRGALPTPLLVYAEVEDPLLSIPEMPRLRHLSVIFVLKHNFHQKHTPKRELLFSLHRWERKKYHQAVAAARKNRIFKLGGCWSPSSKKVFSPLMTSGWHSKPSYLTACSLHENCFRTPLMCAWDGIDLREDPCFSC